MDPKKEAQRQRDIAHARRVVAEIRAAAKVQAQAELAALDAEAAQ
jgi:hypothetical protein